MSMSPDSGDSPATRSDQPRSGADEWDTVRKAFENSIMLNMSLKSLAQNLDIDDWPIEGGEQIPATYIGLSFEELLGLPAIAEHPERIDLLVAILRETLAFDEPFGAMVVANPIRDEKENQLIKNLARLEIPEDFPMSLVALAADTRTFCDRSNLSTLKEFALFGQNLAQAFIVAGDFRALLNALSHIDESTLALYLPFRPGSKGLHLLEGLALLVRAQTQEVQAGLARAYGASIGTDDAGAANGANAEEVSTADELLRQQTPAYVEYFSVELATLQQQVSEGTPLSRLVSVLNDPLVESVVNGLLKAYLKLPSPSAPARKTAPPLENEPLPRKKSFLGTLLKLFRK